MKVLLLNSGIGKRMGDLTKENPKCLVNISNNPHQPETILGHQLKHLQKIGIKDIIITTGPFEEKIKQFIQQHFPDLNIRYIHSDKYDSTNYIYSIHLAKELILDNDEDLLLMHGDLVFEEAALIKLLQHQQKNAVLLDSSIPVPEKDFKGRVSNNLVTEIGVNTFGVNCHFLAPLYKFSADSFRIWLDEIDQFIERGETKVYAENAFNDISHKIPLSPVYYNGLFCMEIDNPEDLDIAKNKLSQLSLSQP